MQAWIAGVVAAFVGIVVGFLLRASSAKEEKAQSDERTQALAAELAKVQAESAARAGFESLANERMGALADRSAQLEAVNRQLLGRDAEILRLTGLSSQLEADLANERGNGERLIQQFKVLASEVLKENSKTFSEQNKEGLSHLLNPLSKDLNDFRVKVEEVKAESLVGRTELREQLKGLESLNKKLSDEAHNLATALRRDTKAQGNWGEIILLDILENSGLQKGEHFTFQESFVEEREEGKPVQRRQTDVVVKLPGGRHLIIDSKVSINAYSDSIKAESEDERRLAVKRHLLSVRNHYSDLAGRNYHRLVGIQSPDFVVMFVPIEPAFMLAMQEDDGIWLDAYKKGVLLAGPTTILFVVRIVENLWNQERQLQNVDEVMDRGARLYEKFAGFVNDMEDLGKSLRSASDNYDEARKKLSEGDGNLIRQVEMLRKLGVKPKPKKPIPLKLLASAGVDEPGLALAVEENSAAE